MKGDGVLRVSPFVDSYNVSVNPNLSKGNVSWNFILAILIEENKGVLPCITAVVLTPSGSWMIGVIKLLSKLGNVGDGTSCGGEGDSGIVCGKSNWFVTLNIFV